MRGRKWTGSFPAWKARAKQRAALEGQITQHENALDSIRGGRARERLLRKTRPATPQDYAAWLTGFVGLGNMPTHYYEYPISRVRLRVAEENLTLYPLYGAHALHVIIPKGLQVKNVDKAGHTDLFWMDGFTASSSSIPCYSDTELLEGKK